MKQINIHLKIHSVTWNKTIFLMTSFCLANQAWILQSFLPCHINNFPWTLYWAYLLTQLKTTTLKKISSTVTTIQMMMVCKSKNQWIFSLSLWNTMARKNYSFILNRRMTLEAETMRVTRNWWWIRKKRDRTISITLMSMMVFLLDRKINSFNSTMR